MNEGQFAADFVLKNLEKIINLAGKAFGKADEVLQVSLRTAYTSYLESTQSKYSKSKSFFIRDQPVDLYSYYIPTGVRCANANFNRPTFRDLSKHSKRIVLTGSGGSGKSVLMKHLFLDCIKCGDYAPILIELRDLNADGKSLDEFVNATLDAFGFNVEGGYIKRAKQSGHFCYFLDGYDEISPDRKKKIIGEIANLSKKFPGCPIVISSRPDDVFNGIEDFSVFSMTPLNLNSAVSLVDKLPFDEVVKKKFVDNLKSGLFDRHKSFLSNPLLLSIMLLTYSENAEIPTKISIFYNQAYEALFQRHDAYKGGFNRARKTQLDIQDFSRVFSLFALQTYEKRLFKMQKTQCLEFIEKSRGLLAMSFKAEDYLADLISAACLLVEDGLEIAFSHRSFQEYFVAKHISQSMVDVQRRLIERYWVNMRSDNVMPLLLEINPDLVESVLLLPKLDALFKSVGVKRSIGITHAVKFFKSSYKELSIDDDIRATYASPTAEMCSVLRMAIAHCETYQFPTEDYFKKSHSEFQKKYGKPGGVAVFDVKTLSARSQILIDLMNIGGVFSIDYLDAGYRAFKILKSKHNNSIQNLESLLGIKS